MTYDDVGNLLTVDGPLTGSADTIRYRYDADRARIGAIGPDPDGIGTLHHRAQRVTYNSLGQASAVETGTVDSQSDGDWAAMTVLQRGETDYDSGHRPVVQRLTAGGTTYALSQTSYDAAGRPDCTAQRMNPAEFASLPSDACTLDTQGSFGPDRIARTTYDDAGQVIKVETGYGVSGVAADEATATYTGNGQVETVTDANGNLTTYVYDGHDRLSRTRMPDPATPGTSSTTDYEELTYATATVGLSTVSTPLVASRRLRDGNSIAFSYDALGRPTLKNLPGAELDVTYGYDLLNRMTSAATSAQTLGFTYDALGRQLTESGPVRTVSSTWNAAGQRLTLEAAGHYGIGYSWLTTGEMAALLNGSNAPIVTFAYDEQGRRTTMALFDGTGQARSYDAVGRLSGLALNLPSAFVAYGYGYNPAGEIVSTTRDNDAFAYTGHANANIASTANGLNQLTAIGGTSNSHDARGNVTAIGGASYTYDSENRLLTAPGGMTYTYDPLGRLYSENDGTSTRLFLYDGNTLFGEYATNGAPLMFYENGPGVDEPLIWFDYNALQFGTLHGDERGSVVASVASSVTSINRYDDYGAPQGTLTGRFGYTGQMWLPGAGLYHYRARAYNPAMGGRFMQTDPIGFQGGMNPYAYVGNNPVNFADPMGTWCTGSILNIGCGSAGTVSGFWLLQRGSSTPGENPYSDAIVTATVWRYVPYQNLLVFNNNYNFLQDDRDLYRVNTIQLLNRLAEETHRTIKCSIASFIPKGGQIRLGVDASLFGFSGGIGFTMLSDGSVNFESYHAEGGGIGGSISSGVSYGPASSLGTQTMRPQASVSGGYRGGSFTGIYNRDGFYPRIGIEPGLGYHAGIQSIATTTTQISTGGC
jgi:RHS repeat-associated protein